MKIKTIESGIITFDNGSTLEYEHRQDCCEEVYANFEHLKLYKDILNIEFKDNLIERISLANNHGFFIIGYLNDIVKIFVPCYNVQNGYYNDELTLIFTDNEGNKKTLDLTKMTSSSFSE